MKSNLNISVGSGIESTVIKELFIPHDLVSVFKTLSQANTDQRKETGGLTAGQYCGGSYQVTHLIIPEQVAASDRWEVHDVRQLTNYFVYNPALIMLGLIQTHPRMSSFLSSVDIHQLYDYAKDNHSLICIVIAPEKTLHQLIP